MRFYYQARHPDGKKVHSELTAPSRAEALSALKTQGLQVFELTLQISKYKISSAKKIFFLKNLSGLLRAGLAADKALELALPKQLLLADRESILSDLKAGVLLSEIVAVLLARHPDLLAMLSAGEKSGNLARATEECAALLQAQEKLNALLRKALFYPLLVLCVLILSLGLLAFLMLPQLALSLNQIPGTSNGISGSIHNLRWILAGLVTVTVLSGLGLRFKPESVPLFGSTWRLQKQSFFLSSLAELLKQGVPLHQAAALLCPVLQLRSEQSQWLIQSLEKGHPFSNILSALKTWPEEVVHGIAAGETAGTLAAQLRYMGEWLFDQTREQVESFGRLAEPALLGLITVLVGFVLWNIFTPLMQVYSQSAAF